ncbi:MAG: winged helix-turn-helix transcriptional regulator [Nitrospiraceae bacterium]|jgi:ArsR family transcriptional regulator|nr:MAG: winged helix-turn-helix transcriptional regulator [Nitrospiraceae bacterium]
MSKESRAICLFLDVSQFNNYNTIMKQNKTLFELQAEVCKTLASPKRLEIINTLKTGEKTVTDLVHILGVSKANVSQHLALMRHKGILSSRREGVNIYYRVANPKVIEACILMRDVLTEQMKEKSKLIDMASKG